MTGLAFSYYEDIYISMLKSALKHKDSGVDFFEKIIKMAQTDPVMMDTFKGWLKKGGTGIIEHLAHQTWVETGGSSLDTIENSVKFFNTWTPIDSAKNIVGPMCFLSGPMLQDDFISLLEYVMKIDNQDYSQRDFEEAQYRIHKLASFNSLGADMATVFEKMIDGSDLASFTSALRSKISMDTLNDLEYEKTAELALMARDLLQLEIEHTMS